VLTNAEIKARYEQRGMPIDRNGAFVKVGDVREVGVVDFTLLLHYHLIQGMSDQTALSRLTGEFEMSNFEAKFLMNKTKAFIKDVLEIDLEEVRKAKGSTASMCAELVTEICTNVKVAYERGRYGDVLVDEHIFQADQKARESILGYLAADTSPEYWVTADNTRIDCDRQLLLAIHEAIVSRDAAYHEKATEQKAKALGLSEARDYAGLVELNDQVKAM
jgi:hypothetical protein